MAGLPWKMMICPMLLMTLNMLKFRYDHPPNRLLLRCLYAISQVAMLICCSYIAYKIKRQGDSKKTVKLKAFSLVGEGAEEIVSYQDYDLAQLKKLASGFLTGAGITTLIHIYMGVVPPLLFQAVMQPISLLEHPLFSIYILNKDAETDDKLKRPFPEKSAKAQWDAARKRAQEERRQRDEAESNHEPALPQEEESEDDGEEHTEEEVQQENALEEEQDEIIQDTGASARTSDSQTSLSTTERRRPRAQDFTNDSSQLLVAQS